MLRCLKDCRALRTQQRKLWLSSKDHRAEREARDQASWKTGILRLSLGAASAALIVLTVGPRRCTEIPALTCAGRSAALPPALVPGGWLGCESLLLTDRMFLLEK